MTAEPQTGGDRAREGPAESGHGSGRVRSLLTGTRDLARVVYRDPDHVSERLTLTLVDRLGEPSLGWAQAVRGRPSADVSAVAADLRRRSVQVARIDGAVAGTPFLIALVPGYLGYLYQEGVMVLHMAALYGRDPRGMQAAAEFLVLRGTHPTVEQARADLERTRMAPMPDKVAERRLFRNWVRSVRMLGVFGGFLSPPSNDGSPHGLRARLRTVAETLFAATIFAITWIVPVTFMLAMSWGCESHTRALGARATALYAGEAEAARDRRADDAGRRRWLRSIALVLSVAVPIAFVAIADRVRNQTGVNALGAAGAIVALSLVIAAAIVARRA